jgi:hypothetical protein
MPFQNKQKQAEYDRTPARRDKRKEYLREYSKLPKEVERRKIYSKNRKMKNRKLWETFAVESGYGECEKCGYNRCFAAIEFHHTDPKRKEANVGSIVSRTFNPTNVARFMEEVNKCDILCANCHREIHYKER